MRIDLSSKNYIVTGAAGSIGREIAKEIMECNGHVFAIDIDNDTLCMLCNSYDSKQYDYCYADLSSSTEIINSINYAIMQLGHIDGLINCVGIISVKGLEELTLDEWNSVLNINLTGVFIAVKTIFTHFKENNGGRIVNVSSVAGKMGGGVLGRIAYATSKAGLNGLTKAIAKEGGKYDILCNAVCPGWTDSRMVNGIITDDDYNRISNMVSQHRPGLPTEIAPLVLFYLSDFANYINGEISDIDGGLVFD